MSVDDLSRLETSHGIDRAAPQRILEKAGADQALLEELAAKHSCELPAWTELAAALEGRRVLAIQAVERVISETLELDDAVFGEISKADCIAVLKGLEGEFARALDVRAQCARQLVAIGAAYKEQGYPGSELVDNAVQRAVAHVRDRAGVGEATAAEYVDHLAQLCGIAVSPPGTPDLQRFPDLSSMFSARPGMALDEVANKLQQTALGLWPAEDGG